MMVTVMDKCNGETRESESNEIFVRSRRMIQRWYAWRGTRKQEGSLQLAIGI